MDRLKADPARDKRAYLIEALLKGIEHANKLDIDEPPLVIPKSWLKDDEKDKE